MGILLESINFQAYAQVEPVEAYRREGILFYDSMMKDIQEEVVSLIFKVDASSSRDFLRGAGAFKLLQQPTIFKLNDSVIPKSQMQTSTDFDGKLIEMETFSEGDMPMNRAERRAAAKRKNSNPRNF
jgi:preprotein translocase subunit SecA